jgi:hypothetical protein
MNNDPLDEGFELTTFSQNQSHLWDSSLNKALNGTLQQSRVFLNYNGRKFQDQSLFINRQNTQAPIAMLPAASQPSLIVSSHPGSAFGGLVVLERLNLVETLEIFQLILKHYKLQGFKEFRYRAVPRIFHQKLWEEDLSALMILGADMRSNRPYQYLIKGESPLGRRRSRISAGKAGCETRVSENVDLIHSVIRKTLLRQHNTEPLHTVEDLKYLMEEFPSNVYLNETVQQDVICAAACVLKLNHVHHFQYLANTEAGRQIHALDNTIEFVWNSLADNELLSFGHSMVPGKNEILNIGLANFKIEFGAMSVPNYELRLQLD